MLMDGREREKENIKTFPGKERMRERDKEREREREREREKKIICKIERVKKQKKEALFVINCSYKRDGVENCNKVKY